MEKNFEISGGFAIVAQEDGVQVIGITRGPNTRLLHTERLEKGEGMVAQFTESIAAVKIRGKATILTPYGSFETFSTNHTTGEKEHG